MSGVLLESRPYRPFKSSEEYLYAMKEDLAEWFQTLYPHLRIATENFMDKLETGVALCEHANAVKVQAAEYVQKKQARKMMTRSVTGSLACAQTLVQICDVKFFSTAKPGTFFARDNLSNFIHWCRQSLQIIECLLFESDDLIMRKNEKHVILCLLEVARRGAKFGMLAPMLVQMERQIDREIAADQRKLEQSMHINEGIENQNTLDDDEDTDSEMDDEQPMLMYGPLPQIVTNDLKSLDEMVRDLVEKCTCPTQFPMIRVSEGKYRIGDTKVLIFVRILRNHVMVRVGGGWDTLSHYLDKHDPCRCRAQHRTTQSANLVKKTGAADLSGAQVYYDRSGMATPQFAANVTATDSSNKHLGPPMNALNRSRSRSPSHVFDTRRSVSPYHQRKSLVPPRNRSRSPTPNYTSTHTTKLSQQSPSKKYYKDGPQSLPYIPTQSPVHVKNRNPSNHVAHIQIPIDSKVTLKSEAVLQVSGGDSNTDHSDNASEVSDEGYRSLGIIGDKTKNRTSLYSQNSAEDADDAERQLTIDCEDTNDAGLRKTQYSSLIYGDKTEPIRRNSEGVRKPDPNFLQAEKHTRHNSIDRGNGEKRIAAVRKTSVQHESTPKQYAKIPVSPKKLTAHKNANNNNNTWNGRQRTPRPQVLPDSFVRNTSARRSVSASNYDNNGRRVSQSAATSPTNSGSGKSCLKQELIKVAKNAQDDSSILEQVHQLLKQFGSLNVLNDADKEEQDMQLKRRKDSKPENCVSRIPAPINRV